MLLCTLQYTYRYIIISRDFYISFVYFNPVSNARANSLSLVWYTLARIRSLPRPPPTHIALLFEYTSHWPQSLTTHVYKPVKHAREMLWDRVIIIILYYNRRWHDATDATDATILSRRDCCSRWTRRETLSLQYIIILQLCYCVLLREWYYIVITCTYIIYGVTRQ